MPEDHECPTCGDEFGTKRGVQLHHAQVHGESIAGFVCDICAESFRGRPARKRHMNQVHSDKDSFECPSCDASFTTENGMKTHHAQKHGESISGVLTTCDCCGDEIRKPRHLVESGANTFCSRDCNAKYRSENYSGESHWQYEQVAAECSVCRERISVKPSRLENNENVFCSRECYADWVSNAYSGDGHPNWRGGPVEVPCPVCGVTVHRRKSYVKKYNAFCSQQCRGEWMSGKYTGEGNPNWSGGRANYGHGWNKTKKKAVRRRDGHECQSCGMSQEDHLEEHGRKLDVHHIRPARTVGDPEERNAEENLISLCISCHHLWEQMAPLRPDTIAAAD